MASQGAPTTWFNKRVFYVNNEPMKFHLDGFDQVETYKIISIVQAYGGKYSEPGKDVVIFTEPHRSSGKYDNIFSAKYLYDCVSSNNTQELSKYSLSKTSVTPSAPSKNGEIRQDPLNKSNNVDSKSTIQGNASPERQLRRDQPPNNLVLSRQLKNTITIKAEVHSEEDYLDESNENPRSLEPRKRKIKVGCSNCKVTWPSFSLIELSDFDDDGKDQVQLREKRRRSNEGSARPNRVESQPQCSNGDYNSRKKEEFSPETNGELDSCVEGFGCARIRIYEGAKTPGRKDLSRDKSGKSGVVGRYERVTTIEMNPESSDYIHNDSIKSESRKMRRVHWAEESIGSDGSR
ncbi:uncharacterized protein LOC107040063 [Diachasma alloeum]|uniref:uncharacterized protein LOC107040063 n=1 Tax=Diachasma alloeum TaxID=454923 RepID=UPI0007384DDB|nr:uncharacterized protein LOC107040063 [Diachasma alloeum]